jgi:hypothetical protein
MHNVQRTPDCVDRTADYHVSHDPSGPAKLSTTVSHALADARGTNVTDSRAALSESVDPESLDRIFRNNRSRPPGHVAFTVDGYRVTVYGTGEIVITPPSSSPQVQRRT